ncbi:MAG: cardiolipin synthase [Planctomycetota bacterium]|nr:cardiolipin synthase [Planctomycetota bacterium]
MSLVLIWTLLEWVIRLVMIPVVLRRRFQPSTALAWLSLISFFPPGGLVIYFLIGANHLGRRRFRKYSKVIIAKRTDARLAGRKPHITQPNIGAPYLPVVIQASRISGMPIIGGNSVSLMTGYEQAINWLVEDIDSAQKHVHLLYYIFSDDKTGQLVGDALVRAARRGVRCRVLADATGSRPLFARRGLGAKLKAEGVEVHPVLPVSPFQRPLVRIDLRNHRKLAVIDCRTAHAGSQNIIDTDYDCPGGPDTIDLVGRFRGPIVAQLQSVFLEDWEFETGKPLEGEDLMPEMTVAGETHAQVVATGPSNEIEGQALPRVLLAAFNAAQKRIIITTPYLVPDEPMLFALTMAAERGVEVTLVVPRSSDHALVTAAARSHFETLLESGVRIFLHRRGMLHSKTATVDDAVALLGSSNLDMRSFYLNFELNVLLYGPEVTAQLSDEQMRYVAESERIDLAMWRRRPALQRFADSAAALLSPLL